MDVRKLSVAFRWLSCIGLLAILGTIMSVAGGQDVPPPLPMDPNGAPSGNPNGAAAVQSDPNVEVMTRGPVHEAYAVPVTSGQTAGVIVPKQPANPIEEVPPDLKPEGQNSVWIPGYWSWDDERRDFIWVSGVWRIPPHGYRWMPGYWQDAQGQGFQRISGYWMPAAVQETTYLPQPPQSIDTGPNMAAPGPNYFWIPGHWQWFDVQNRYLWQPGYWAAYQADWIWVPATYAWTPGGYVYVPGYWDYPLARRGLVFSPVYFAGPVAVYRPAICVDAGVFSVGLFCRPTYGHYYFGDYYDDRYVALGIRPYFYYNSPRIGYDPLFGYYRWYHVDHMGERDWDRHLVGWHDYYRTHPDMRPPHTWGEQQRLLASREGMARPDIARLRMVGDVHVVARMPGASVRVQVVSPAERAHIQEAARASVHAEAERRQVERQAAGGAGRGAQKVSLASMPSYKSAPGAGAAPGNSAYARPGGAAAGPGAAGNPAGRAPARPAAGSKNKNGRKRKRKRNRKDKDPPEN